MDYYCSFRTCRANFTPCELTGPGSGPLYDLSCEPHCAQTLRGLYERYVYPRISAGSKTKALAVPGAFAPTGQSAPCRAWETCDNPLNSTGTAYDRFWALHATELWNWAVEDPRLEGFAPWHWSDEPSYGVRMARGMKDMPETVSVYTELGLRMKRVIDERERQRED